MMGPWTKEIKKTLRDVPAGGWFFIRGDSNHIYMRLAEETAGGVKVANLKTGNVPTLLPSLTVIEISRSKEVEG